ncbi:MAG: Fe-S-containing protein [Clostridiales Family XIII bacterium]|jgi:uncharacterized membrane protein|nr:Fe-S-containing protein [Clostridiales Family XIII bacterium]
MLKYLILVIENALGTAILVALILALVYAGGVRGRQKWAAAGGLAGLAAAAVLAFITHKTLLVGREFFNFGVLPLAILSGLALLVLTWTSARASRRTAVRNPDGSPPPEGEPAAAGERALCAAAALFLCTLLLYCLSAVFLYPTQFLLAGESALSTDFLFKSIGYLAGLLLAVLAGLALFKAHIGVPARLLRILSAIALLVNIIGQLSTILQFLVARRLIPMTKALFEIVKFTANHDMWFLYAILAAALVLPCLAWARSLRLKGEWANPAQLRKAKSTARGIRRWSALILACYLLSVFSLTAVKAFDEREVTLSPAEPAQIADGRISISIDTVNDGRLHRFAYMTPDGIEVRFIVIKKNESAWGVGLDACDICGATGYYERGEDVICKLCDVVMNKATIGFKGGCNPVPLAYTVSGGILAVQTADLEAEQKRFK